MLPKNWRWVLASMLLAACFGSAGMLSPLAQAESKLASLAEHRTKAFVVGLDRDTQTLRRLSPLSNPTFDFAPSNRAAERQGDGYVHLGDLHVRVRTGGGEWRDFSSARTRAPVRVLPRDESTIAAADITATFGPNLPLSIERHWLQERDTLVLRFTLINTSSHAVEIGGLGLPMVFDNIITDRSLEQAHEQASFVDRYIGRDAGYLQVTRLSGAGPAASSESTGSMTLSAALVRRGPRIITIASACSAAG